MDIAFAFPHLGQVMLSREFAFCLFINTHMHMHIFRIMKAYVCE